MRSIFLTVTLIFFTILQSYSCDCECTGDCSFGVLSRKASLVVLVKVVSYDNFLNHEISGYSKRMPYSMTVEVVTKFKGDEERKFLKIWGDNGALCRPYIANFKIGEYYLMIPHLLGKGIEIGENETDFELSSCLYDYLKVDLETKIATGKFSKTQDQIHLTDFENFLNQ